MKATCSRSLVATVVVATLSVCLVPGTALAAETVSILAVVWTSTPNPALVVSASGPLRYTESRPAAGVLLVQFPEATPSGAIAPVAEPAAGLSNATLAVVEKGGVKSTGLRIEFDPAARVTVNALPAGIEVRFEKAEKNVAHVQELLDVLAVADGTGVTISLASHGRIEGRAFTLADPPRVVVDLRGVVNRVAKREHPVGAEGVRRVRVAQFATSPDPVVRVVVDLESDLPYRLESTEHGALVRIGKEPAPIVAAVEVAPSSPSAVAPAEQPQPAKVADVAPAGGELTPTPPVQSAPTPSEPAREAKAAKQPEKAAPVPVSPVMIVDVPAPVPEPAVSAPAPPVRVRTVRGPRGQTRSAG